MNVLTFEKASFDSISTYIRAFHIAMKSLVPLTTNRFGLSDRRSAVLKLIGWFKNLRRSVKVFMIFQIKFPRHGDPELFTTSVFCWLVFFVKNVSQQR